jgi:hypothetical protein
MNISLIASVDETTYRIRNKVIPLAIDSLQDSFYIDYALRESVYSKISGKGYYSPEENVVMSISLDPKNCGTAKEYCSGDCNNCPHNPLEGLIDSYCAEGPFVIASRYTIEKLLDVISLLAGANKNALLREIRTREKELKENNQCGIRKEIQYDVEQIIKTLEEIVSVEERYNENLPDHPSFEELEMQSNDNIDSINEAIENLQSVCFAT